MTTMSSRRSDHFSLVGGSGGCISRKNVIGGINKSAERVTTYQTCHYTQIRVATRVPVSTRSNDSNNARLHVRPRCVIGVTAGETVALTIPVKQRPRLIDLAHACNIKNNTHITRSHQFLLIHALKSMTSSVSKVFIQPTYPATYSNHSQ